MEKKIYRTKFGRDGHVDLSTREFIRGKLIGINLGIFGRDAYSVWGGGFTGDTRQYLVVDCFCTAEEYERFAEAVKCGNWGYYNYEFYCNVNEE